MRVRYTSGRLSTEFEGNQTEIFAALAEFQEIFEETSCGKCGSDNIGFVVREVKGNKFHELHCRNPECHAKLAFGKHRQTETLFPRRKAGNNDPTGLPEGEWLPDRGWIKWDASQKKAV